jgi:hypothetical protein
MPRERTGQDSIASAAPVRRQRNELALFQPLHQAARSIRISISHLADINDQF